MDFQKAKETMEFLNTTVQVIKSRNVLDEKEITALEKCRELALNVFSTCCKNGLLECQNVPEEISQ